MADDDEKKSMPLWVKRLLIIVSIVGPLTGAVVTTTQAYYDVKAKAKEANVKTEAGYETLAPAIKELQELLIKTQDAVDSQIQEIALLKADRDDKEKRIMRLEAYVDVLGRRPTLPDAPPEVKPVALPVASRFRKISKPNRPIPADMAGAQQLQMTMP